MPIYKGFSIAILIAKGGKDGFPLPILDPLQKTCMFCCSVYMPIGIAKAQSINLPITSSFP